ncbi:MAG: hypothetical protein KIS87_04715 [Phycisphaeraceae bacterium]|nr:hypothetical protein [Phycisphaeraceae bacterium]
MRLSMRILCVGVIATAATPSIASDDAVRAAIELGITPSAAAAAGINGTAATALLARIGNATEERLALSKAHASVRQLTRQVSALRVHLQRHPNDDNAAAELRASLQSLAAANQSVRAALDELWSVALEGVQHPADAGLVAQRAGRGRVIDVPLRATMRSDAQYLELESALVAERRALRLGEDLPDEVRDVLVSARTAPEVITANALHTSLISQVTVAYDAWSSE